ncbi:MAG TPA: CBS domain-containing protein [Candidatus Saccharimonadia bacterium]|nr:CBS domain-containing protein [Candidatus Saccharimonadia bacterium]
MDVKSTMTPDPACCTPQTKLADVAKMMVDNDCGEIPVVADKESRKPVGVITDRDIVIRTLAKGIDPMQKTAGDCMTSPAVTVTPDMSLVECCDVMEREQIRRVPVVAEDGRLCGIVALADVVQHAGRRTTAEVLKEVSEANGDSRTS